MLTDIDAKRLATKLTELEERQAEQERLFTDPILVARHLLSLVREAGTLAGPIAQKTEGYATAALAVIAECHPMSPN